MANIIDAWRESHGGYPPLRCLSIDTRVMMHDLETLDLEEIQCYCVSDQISKAHLPSGVILLH